MRHKLILEIVAAIAIMSIAASGDEIWFIPGWLRCHAPEQDAVQELRRLFPESQVVYKDWDGNQSWSHSVVNADACVSALSDEITVMSSERRSRLTVIGHSLGGRIAARVNARLAAGGCRIRQIILMGAAIPYTDRELTALGKATEMPVLNFCNSRDVTLKYCYGVIGGEDAPALGANGMLRLPENYREIVLPSDIIQDVTMSSDFLNSDVIKRLTVHYAPFYIAALERFMKDTAEKSSEILVPQHFLNERIKVLDGGVWWEVLESCRGWTLQVNKLTGHCRILNPADIREAWGGRRRMTEAFRKVRLQLEAQAQPDDGQ